MKARQFRAGLLLSVAVLLVARNNFAATPASGEPPVIDEQPISRNATVGGHATFSVFAHGTVPLTFQWRKGSEILTNNARITGTMNAVLNIDPVLVSDTSNYTVVVTAGTGSITSAPASLVVSQLIMSAPVPTGTGAVIHLYGQIGDVYRVELNVDFGGWKTNGYATNRTGRTEHFDNGTGGGFRQFVPLSIACCPCSTPAAERTPRASALTASSTRSGDFRGRRISFSGRTYSP